MFLVTYKYFAERQGNEPISLCRFNSTLYQYVNA